MNTRKDNLIIMPEYKFTTAKVSYKWNLFPKNMNATELNFLHLIIAKATEENNQINVSSGVIEISKNEVLKNFTWSDGTIERHWTNGEFDKFLAKFGTKITRNFIVRLDTQKSAKIFSVFKSIEWIRDYDEVDYQSSPVIRITLNDDAPLFFQNLGADNPYYIQKLPAYCSIRAVHTKQLYSLISQNLYRGHCSISISDAKIFFEVPKYSNRNLTILIKKAVEDLKPMVNGLNMTVAKDKAHKNAIKEYRFTFKPKANIEDAIDVPATPVLGEKVEPLSELEIIQSLDLTAERPSVEELVKKGLRPSMAQALFDGWNNQTKQEQNIDLSKMNTSDLEVKKIQAVDESDDMEDYDIDW